MDSRKVNLAASSAHSPLVTFSRSLALFGTLCCAFGHASRHAFAQSPYGAADAAMQTGASRGAGVAAFDRAAPNGSTYQPGSHAGLPEETLGKGDLIEIMVPYCPELSHSFRVGPDGNLSLPLLQKPIPVIGLTPAETSARIRQSLVSDQVLADPVVSVAVVEYRSRPVSVLGAVVHPLTIQATGDITLLDAVAMAGGFTPAVGTNVLITTKTVDGNGVRENTVRTIPVSSLLVLSNPADNPILHGGEEIRIPEAGKIFVAGNVSKPGVYTMQGDEKTTVMKALALSEGLQHYSSHVAYIYRRRTSDGGRDEILVQLQRIMDRKDKDVWLVADDILYVPESNGKRMTAKVLSGLAGFGQTTAAGVLIYR